VALVCFSDELLKIPHGGLGSSSGGAGSLPFFTDFSGANASPISDDAGVSALWVRANNSWLNVRRVGNVVRPTALTGGSVDNYTLLDATKFAGGIPNNVEVIATLDIGAGITQEHEILLRASDNANAPDGEARCYEFLYNAASASVDIVKWLGPFNQGPGTSFVSIGAADSAPGTGATGNQIRATAVGSALTFYWRASSADAWTQIAHATDSAYASGTCGIGFFPTGSASIDALGFTDYQVTAL
jgi:hypothetical protein